MIGGIGVNELIILLIIPCITIVISVLFLLLAFRFVRAIEKIADKP